MKNMRQHLLPATLRLLAAALFLVALLPGSACGSQSAGTTNPTSPAATTTSGAPSSAPTGTAPQSGVRLLYQVNLAGADSTRAASIVDADVSIMRFRLDALGISQFAVKSAPGNSILVQVSQNDGEAARQIVSLNNIVEFAEQTYTSDPAARWPVGEQLWRPTTGTVNGKEEALSSFFFQKSVKVITGGDGQPALQYQLTPDGVTLASQVSARLLNKPISLFYGRKLLSSTTLQAPLGEAGTIEGLTADSANQLAKLLNVGSLAAPLILMEDTTF